MSEFHSLNDSIECMKCRVIARKVVPSTPIKDPILGMGIKYSLSRNASAQIVEELNPKKHKINPASQLNLNDILKADSISAFVASIKPIKRDVINNSHTHKASEFVLSAFCHAFIKYPLENVVNSIQSRRIGEKED